MASSSPWSILYFTESQCHQNLSSPTITLHIAEIDGVLVGFAATNVTGMEGEPLLEYICVDSNYRGQGIGSQMLEFIEKKLYPYADNIYLFVSDINPRAIALYERIGYEQIGELANYNLFGQTEFLYRKFRCPRQERFRPKTSTAQLITNSSNLPRRTSLTEQQNEGIEKGAFDLATGYARIPLPDVLRELVLEGTSVAMKKTTSDKIVWQELCHSVGHILGITPSIRSNIRSTFSGSIALDRVFTAIRDYTKKVGKSGLTAIIHEPVLDLSYLLLKEHDDLHIVGVKSESNYSSNRVDNLIDQLEKESKRLPSRQIIIILDSPSNPLGIVTAIEDMERLAISCKMCNAILIVDHCFLLAGIHMPNILPNIFRLSSEICDWVGIWDTGKTIDVSGDKIAFIIPGSHRMTNIINNSLSVIHQDFYSAQRTIEVFSRLLSAPEIQSYIEYTSQICRNNLKYIQSCIDSTWSVPTPSAGTCICLYKHNQLVESDEIREDFLKAGVSVVASRTFYPSTSLLKKELESFVRISLFRDSAYFQSAINKLPIFKAINN
jgi:bifunctional pyridoxal-dependent enzyme with beta-cystathionase and maltose regulon repressor activities/RimJ/RimL family protein N-acetyltransferase